MCYLCNLKQILTEMKTIFKSQGLMKKNKAMGLLRKPISLFAFSGIVSIITLLLYNIPFFKYVAENTNESTFGRLFLLASLGVVMLALNFIMTNLVMFLLRIVGRILLAILAIINATAVYFIYTYSVMIDATTIENVFNTRYSEASGFFSWSLWLSIIAFGVLGFSGMFKKVKRTASIIVAGVLILLTVVLFTVSLLSSGDADMIAELKRRWWIVALEAGVTVILTALALVFQKKATASSVSIASGLAVTGVLRFVCHFISGVTVWSDYAADKTAVMYSLYYNLSYMLPEIILTVVMAAIISNLLNFDAETMDVIWKDDSKVKKLWDDDKPDA